MSDYPPPPPPPPGVPPWSPPGSTWSPAAMPRFMGRYAGFGSRFGAVFVDGLLLSPFGIAARIELSTGAKKLQVCSFDASRLCRVPTASTWALWALISIAGVVAGIFYYGILEGRTGQTIGKRAASIKVLDAKTGAPIGFGRAVGRHFAKILSALPCFLGYFWMLWDPNKQTWHDKIVGSYVVAA